MAHDRQILTHCGCTTSVRRILFLRTPLMSKRLLVPLAIAFTLVAASASAAEVETIALFNPAIPETPESIEIDKDGNIYTSFNFTGEIRKVATDGTHSTLAMLPLRRDIQPCLNVLGRGGAGGIALDHDGNLYASVNSCNAPDLGVWKVEPEGQMSLVAQLPGLARPNGIAYHEGKLYVADSNLGQIWRIDVACEESCEPEIWSNDPLLQNTPSPFPNANGVQIFDDAVYVSVTTRGHIVAIPIRWDGSAGPARVHATVGVDDFAFDKTGNLHAGTNASNRFLLITPTGEVHTLLTIADELDGPTSAAFGVKNNKKWVYIANGAFPPFPGQNPRRPSIMRLHIGIKGEPRP
jgi:sugar lactone lactonase YvrE